MNSLDRMQKEYGFGVGQCRDCCNYVKHTFNRTYHKCAAFGESHSMATDWRGKWNACGLFNKPFEDLRPARRPLIEVRMKQEVEADETIDGQIELGEI